MSSYRVTLRSIANFDNFQTILVDYFLMPIISLGMFLLIAYNSNQDYSRILVGTIVTSGIATAIGIINASAVYDQNIGIIDEVLSIKPKFHTYWLPKFVIAGATLTVETLILASIGLSLLNKVHLLINLLLALPLIIITASLLGYFSVQLGLKRENPYWFANIITGVLVLLSGVIIPVSQYPFWMKIFAELLPISNILDWILGHNLINLFFAILKIFLWWIICIITREIVHKNIRK